MVSVIIPVFNEPSGLKQTLDAFIHQKFPSDAFEVIVVDNGSTDDTYAVAQAYQERYPLLVKAIKEDTLQGSYAARNKGIGMARGEIICFIDADMTVEHDYLEQVFQFFKNFKVDYLGCHVEVYSDKNTLAAKYNQINGFRVDGDLKNNQFVPTCCLSVRRSVFDVVGTFDYRLESGGDYEFGQRVFRAGLIQKFADHIVMKHPARWKYSSLFNKSKRIARGIAQLNAYYPGLYTKDYRKYFKKKRYLPKNPLTIYRKAKQRDVSVNWIEIFLLSFYHIPITFVSTAEIKKLASQKASM